MKSSFYVDKNIIRSKVSSDRSEEFKSCSKAEVSAFSNSEAKDYKSEGILETCNFYELEIDEKLNHEELVSVS